MNTLANRRSFRLGIPALALAFALSACGGASDEAGDAEIAKPTTQDDEVSNEADDADPAADSSEEDTDDEEGPKGSSLKLATSHVRALNMFTKADIEGDTVIFHSIGHSNPDNLPKLCQDVIDDFEELGHSPTIELEIKSLGHIDCAEVLE